MDIVTSSQVNNMMEIINRPSAALSNKTPCSGQAIEPAGMWPSWKTLRFKNAGNYDILPPEAIEQTALKSRYPEMAAACESSCAEMIRIGLPKEKTNSAMLIES